MAALDYLDKLRQRPEAERQRLVIWFSILITLILFVLWLLNLQFIWQNESTAPAPVVQTTKASETGWWQDSLMRIQAGWQTITNQTK